MERVNDRIKYCGDDIRSLSYKLLKLGLWNEFVVANRGEVLINVFVVKWQKYDVLKVDDNQENRLKKCDGEFSVNNEGGWR